MDVLRKLFQKLEVARRCPLKSQSPAARNTIYGAVP